MGGPSGGSGQLPAGTASPAARGILAGDSGVRGRIELPTFRSSGLRNTVQDWPRSSTRLLSDLRWTPIDAGVRGRMRPGMRLLRPAPWPLGSTLTLSIGYTPADGQLITTEDEGGPSFT